MGVTAASDLLDIDPLRIPGCGRQQAGIIASYLAAQ